MIIALFPNISKRQSKNVAIGIKEFLHKADVQVVVDDEDAELVGADPLSSVPPEDVNYVITLGGDGTILRMLHRHPEIKAPIMGINLGSLGFLADIPIPEIYPSLTELLNGECVVDERMVINAETITGERCFAVNDIVIHRAKNPSLIDLSVHVDGLYVNTFAADGLIVATPIGSTAYSLAAGGPIIEPGTAGLVMTPISAHTISNRPIVVKPQKEITIQYLSEAMPVELSNDGLPFTTLNAGEELIITFSERKFLLVSRKSSDYFSTLRKKLGWSGKMRNS